MVEKDFVALDIGFSSMYLAEFVFRSLTAS